MKQRLFSLLFTLTLTTLLHANDGVFYMSGTHLVPLKETDIELKKEILEITKIDDQWTEIKVDFTFLNTGKAKTETVGFVYSQPFGDVEGDEPYLKDFTVRANGETLDYKDAPIDKSQLEEYAQNQDRAFHFKVNFKKGENKILHTYTYKHGQSVDEEYAVHYVVTSARSWANEKVDDFSLIIDMGEGELFTVPASLESMGAEWKVGDGRISSSFPHPRGEGSAREVRQGSKPVRYVQKGFEPVNELYISSITDHFRAAFIDKNITDLPKEIKEVHNGDYMAFHYFYTPETPIKELPTLTPNQLRFFRNLPYAKKGYDFKNKELKDLFSKFFWYAPQPGKEVILNEKEAKFVSYIKSLEK